MDGLLGKKIGMTQVFTEEGEAVPVTVVEVGPCYITQVKTEEKDDAGDESEGKVEDPSAEVEGEDAGEAEGNDEDGFVWGNDSSDDDDKLLEKVDDNDGDDQDQA